MERNPNPNSNPNPNPPARSKMMRQSSLAPEREENAAATSTDEAEMEAIDSRVGLMYLANEGDLEGIKELLNSGTDVNFQDIDKRTALHLAACQGSTDVVQLLLDRGAVVDAKDRWGSTPLADAVYYKNHDVIKLLEKHGAKPPMAPMHVQNAREVPEYEIDPSELDFSNSVDITKGTFRIALWRGIQVAVKTLGEDVIKLLEKHGAKPPMAPMHVQNAREVPEYEIDPSELDFSNSVDITKGTFRIALWRGIQVAVKTLGEEVFSDDDKVEAFRDELAVLQKIRHPNVVQFLGAVTQSSPMMIVTEYLPKGDFCSYLKRKHSLKPLVAVKFALDIARGMNYLHEHKPEAIIHRDLEPSNLLRDDSGHLKVADFGVSKQLEFANTVKENRPITSQDASWRYVAPEVYKNEEYDTKVDVFSFALILQEMIEGYPPFSTKPENEVPKLYVSNERPPFRAPTKHYAHGLKELIQECWSDEPFKRPTFRKIIVRLDGINNQLAQNRRWKIGDLNCFRNLEAFMKRNRLNPSIRSSSSTIR